MKIHPRQLIIRQFVFHWFYPTVANIFQVLRTAEICIQVIFGKIVIAIGKLVPSLIPEFPSWGVCVCVSENFHLKLQ